MDSRTIRVIAIVVAVVVALMGVAVVGFFIMFAIALNNYQGK